MIRAPDAAALAALRETVSFARTLPYYRARWPRAARINSIGGFAELPLLAKAEAARAQEALRAPGAPPMVGVVSSATTRDGRPLRVPRSPPRAVVRAERPIRSLRIFSPRHGGEETTRTDQLLLAASLHDNSVDVLCDVLAEHRPAELVAPLSTLKWVTVAMRERAIDPARFGVQVIGCTGYAVTRAARRWLEPLWRAPLVDNWSMSELEGYAYPCRHCRYSHWEGAPVWFELLGASSGRPVGTRGVGELVVTTLLPHGALMPLVRYRTGDLMELGPPCRARAGRRGVRFRGRTSTSALRGDVPLALSGDLLEVGEAHGDIAQVPHPAEMLGLVPASGIGVPKLRVRRSARRWVVDVELRFAPARAKRRAAAARQAVAAVVDASVDVVLHPPGALDLLRLARKL